MASEEAHDEFFAAALSELSGGSRLVAEDPRWSHLFRSETVLRCFDGSEELIVRCMSRLVQHNSETGNALVLLEHAISRVRQLRAFSKPPATTTVVQCCVALRLTRFVFNFMCAHLSDAEMRRQFGLHASWPHGGQAGAMSGGQGPLAEGDTIVVGLLKELLQLCATNPNTAPDWMQDLLFEGINLTITLFSTQLYNPFPPGTNDEMPMSNPFLEFAFVEASQQHTAMLTRHGQQSNHSLAIRLVQALLEHVSQPEGVRDSATFSRVSHILAESALEQQSRERSGVTPSQPVANIAAALPSLAELKAVSETIWEGIATFGTTATSILSLPFSWTRMYSLIFNAAARARGHLSGTLITTTSSSSTPHPQEVHSEPTQPVLNGVMDLSRCFEKGARASISPRPLAQRCILLLLVLVHNHRAPGTTVNPFREAFCTLADAAPQPNEGSGEEHPAMKEDALSNVHRIHASFAELIGSVSKEVPLESSTLLLYTLLQSNSELMYSILECNGPERMMESVLHGLYQPILCNGTKHLYTLVITLLMCTQDEMFVANSFRHLKLQLVPWYKERLLKNISVGSLSVLCLLRTLVFALISARDEYLLANVLATLSNLSNHIENLHPYAAQRIVVVCIKLARRLAAMSNAAIEGASLATIVRAQEPDAPASLRTPPSSRSTVDDVQSCAQALRTLLMLVWQSLRVPARSGNVHMLYSLVHQSQEVSVLLGHPSVVELCPDAATIVQVTHHFYKQLREEEGEISTSEQAVHGLLAAINSDAEVQLDSREVMTFSYEEGQEPEPFFVPYVWEVVTSATPDLGWHLPRINIFDPTLSPLFPNDSQRAATEAVAAVMSLDEHV